MAFDPNEAIFDWPVAAGTPAREVWYSLVCPPGGDWAFWYRYTLLSTTGGDRGGRVWAAYTDRERPEASKFVSKAVPLPAVGVGSDPFRLTLGSETLQTNAADGTIDGLGWSVTYEPDEYAFTPLRSRRLTDLLARLAGTGKHWSRNQSIAMRGEVRVGDHTHSLEEAPGHQGHTVTNRTPPDAWTWVHCNDFETDETAVLEALELDGKLSICVRLDGEVYALNRLHHVLPVSPAASRSRRNEVGSWEFEGSGDGLAVRVSVTAPPEHWQRVAYKLPDGALRYNAHCSLASVRLTYARDGGSETTLESETGRAEWVGDEPPVPGEYRPNWD